MNTEEHKPLLGDRQETPALSEPYDYITELFARYEALRADFPAEKRSMGFSNCSARIQNAFQRAQILTVGDLFEKEAYAVFEIPQLGQKSFKELCDFLEAVADGKVTKTTPRPAPPAKIPLPPEEAISRMEECGAECGALFDAILCHLKNAAAAKLPPRSADIFLIRLGYNGTVPTLEAIGKKWDLSRERIRQLFTKAMRMMLRWSVKAPELWELDRQKTQLRASIEAIPAPKFISFLVLSGTDSNLLDFICRFYLKNPTDLGTFRDAVLRGKAQKAKTEEKSLFNEALFRQIVFPRERHITDADFARLQSASAEGEEQGHLVTFEGVTYPCTSQVSQSLLEMLLKNRTFKAIKLRALKFPNGDREFVSALQCLTHDNRLVLIEPAQLLHMCTRYTVEKYDALRAYCQKYGFGYLMTDGRGNSFEEITEENPAFSAAILAELSARGAVSFDVYKPLFDQTGATVENFLALIKRESLKFSLSPFRLTR